MTSSISAVTVLKVIYLDSFSSESLKAKMFIIQMNNKIADAVEATEGQKIRYAMLLLHDSVLKWAATFMNNEEEIIFDIYAQFKLRFLRRFMDSNLIESTIKKLMNLHQKKTSIMDYCTKVMNLAELINLKN